MLRDAHPAKMSYPKLANEINGLLKTRRNRQGSAAPDTHLHQTELRKRKHSPDARAGWEVGTHGDRARRCQRRCAAAWGLPPGGPLSGQDPPRPGAATWVPACGPLPAQRP